MLYRSFIVSDMFMGDMGHIQESATSTFQSRQYSRIPAEVCGVQMNCAVSANFGLLPFYLDPFQSAFDCRFTNANDVANLRDCLFVFKI